ncbi:NAD(P)-binding protein [Stipitochalara longipes BDJ]|nr:NAD(P)-binding protein [Stipitochalara longipes BDJ]
MDRSVFITGANGGLGTAFISLTHRLHSQSIYGIYAVRNTSTAQSLSEILASQPQSRYELFPIDLSSLHNIRASATLLNRRVSAGEIPPIQALILNAAVQQVDGKRSTVDGLESHFAVNYLANFLFVLMVLESMDKERGKIVIISTAMHDSYHWMNNRIFPVGQKDMLTNIEAVAHGGPDGKSAGEKHGEGMRRYAISKCLLVMFMYQLKDRLNKDSNLSRIAVMSLDPGGMGGAELTKRGSTASKFLWGYVMPVVQSICVYLWPNGVLRTSSKSAADLTKACFEYQGDFSKAIYLNGTEQITSSKESRDEEKQGRLWKESVKLVGLNESDTALKYWQ